MNWQPIETAPSSTLVIVGWSNNGEGNYDFDYFEDEVWQRYFNNHEHYLIAGAAKGNSEDVPYTHWMPLPEPPKQSHA